MKDLIWVMRYLKDIKWWAILAVLLLVVSAISFLFLTGIQKYIIDDVFMDKQYELLVPLILIFGGAILTAHVPGALFFVLALSNQYHIRSAIWRDLLRYIQNMPVKNYQNEKTGNYMHYFSWDATSIADAFGLSFPKTLRAVINVIILIGLFGFVSPGMLLLVLLLSVLYIGLGKYFGPRVKEANKEVSEKKSVMMAHVEEGISSSREVIAFHRIEWERNQYYSHFRNLFKSIMAEGKMANVQMLSSEPLRWGANLAVLAFGGYQVMQGSMTLGFFVVTYQFASQLMFSINEVYTMLMGVSGRMASVGRVRRFIEGDRLKTGNVPLIGRIESLSFKNVEFQYGDEGRSVLNGLTMDIPIGYKVAIVGTSGGGKSTIAQLLLRFFDPLSGLIMMNNVHLDDIKREDWNTKLGIVFQDPYLLPDTIRNNLKLHRGDLSDDELVRVCRLAQIHEFIEGLPNGYDTEVGERGIMLSGGQRQRLVIARALLTNPELLILDEATSALDMETERRLQAAVDEQRKGLTTIVIAHRLSTVQNADKIFLIDGGCLAEEGTHDELMKQGGLYTRLV